MPELFDSENHPHEECADYLENQAACPWIDICGHVSNTAEI